MDLLEEIFIDDDLDIIDIIEMGFPKRIYDRTDYFDQMDNLTFFKRFRLMKPTVEMVLDLIEENLESAHINNRVSSMNQLLATLRFYACGNHQDSIGDFVGAHQTTISRIVKRVSMAIASLRPLYIKMPIAQEIQQVQQSFFKIARFPKIIGCVDGTHIKLQSPGGEDAEIYRNRKSYFSVNAQVVCDASLKIRDLVARWPGSAHDLTIFNNSRLRARIEEHEFPNSFILGDSGYVDRSYLMTPHPNPRTMPQQLYNESLIRTRNCVERSIGVWKRRFICLLYGLRCSMETNIAVIVATAVLNNIAIEQKEGNPPNPENIDNEELEYLLALGNIDIPAIQTATRGNTFRNNLIQEYFANL